MHVERARANAQENSLLALCNATMNVAPFPWFLVGSWGRFGVPWHLGWSLGVYLSFGFYWASCTQESTTSTSQLREYSVHSTAIFPVRAHSAKRQQVAYGLAPGRLGLLGGGYGPIDGNMLHGCIHCHKTACTVSRHSGWLRNSVTPNSLVTSCIKA